MSISNYRAKLLHPYKIEFHGVRLEIAAGAVGEVKEVSEKGAVVAFEGTPVCVTLSPLWIELVP